MYPTVELAVLQPVFAIISGNPQVGISSPIILSGSQSKGASQTYPFAHVVWLLTFTSQPQPLVEQILMSFSQNKSLEIVIPASLMLNVTQTLVLTFSLTLMSSFNATSSAEYNVTVLSQPAPVLSFSDNVFQTNVDPSRRWSIQVTAFSASCSSSVQNASDTAGAVRFRYQWSQRSGPTIDAFSSGPRLTSQLALPPFSFAPGSSYELEVNVSALPPSSSCWIVSAVSVQTLPFQRPVPIISTGSYARISSTNVFVIDGSNSYDPNFASGSPQSLLSYKWQCYFQIRKSSGPVPCFSTTPLVNSTMQVMAQSIISKSSSVLTFLPGMLRPTVSSNNLYVFTLQVSSNSSGLSASTVQTVSVSDSPVPGVSISTSLNGLTSLAVSRPFFAIGHVTDPLNSSDAVDFSQGLYQCIWVCEQGGFDMTLGNPYLYSDPSALTLSIAANALAPGRTYVFSLSAWATATPQVLGYSRVSFVVNLSPPSGGSCTCDPPNGDAGTAFTLSCINWQAGYSLGPLALTYEFSVKLPTGVLLPLSAARSVSPSLIVQLPASSSNSSTIVVVNVCDPSSACTIVSLEVEVMPILLIVDAAQRQISTIVQFGDHAALLAAAVIYSTATGNSSDKQIVSSALLDAVLAVGNSSNPNPADQVGMLFEQSMLTQTVMLVVGAPEAAVSANSISDAQSFISQRTNKVARYLRSGPSSLSVSYDSIQLAQQLAHSTLAMFDGALATSSSANNSTFKGPNIFCKYKVKPICCFASCYFINIRNECF